MCVGHIACACSPEVAAASDKAEEAGEEAPVVPTPEQLEIRLKNLLDTCTYVVYNYTRRGLFDRDKLIVLTLLTFQILLTVSAALLLPRHAQQHISMPQHATQQRQRQICAGLLHAQQPMSMPGIICFA